MILYLDTSVLVTVLTKEPESQRVIGWLEAQSAGDLAVSQWVGTEYSAALSIKLRSGQLSLDERAACLATYNKIISSTLEILPVVDAHFLSAARLADRATLGLRGGDALHLAIATSHGATIVTRDRRMADAASELGVSARLL